MTKAKPVVQYTPTAFDYIQEGMRACVVPVNHPDTYNVSNGREAITSPVVWYNSDTGEFETLNTRYVRATA